MHTGSATPGVEANIACKRQDSDAKVSVILAAFSEQQLPSRPQCDIHHGSIALRGGGLNLSQSRMPSDMREAFALLDSGRGWKEAQKRRYIRQKKRQSARSSRDYIIHWWIGASLGSTHLHNRRKAVRSNLYKRSRSPRGGNVCLALFRTTATCCYQAQDKWLFGFGALNRMVDTGTYICFFGHITHISVCGWHPILTPPTGYLSTITRSQS